MLEGVAELPVDCEPVVLAPCGGAVWTSLVVCLGPVPALEVLAIDGSGEGLVCGEGGSEGCGAG